MSRFTIIYIAMLLAVVGASRDPLTECYHEPTKHHYPVGEKYNPIGHCEQHSCQSDGTYGLLFCPAVMQYFDGSCTFIEEDVTKPYPDCCAKCVENK